MRLFLVRHGQSEGNVDKSKYFEKSDCDIELTGQGKADAVRAADFIYSYLHDKHMEATFPQPERQTFNLVHSTYKRATQTANILFDRLNDNEGYSVDKVTATPLCREREWGGLRDIVESKLRKAEHFNFYYRPSNGESFADTYTRAAIFHQGLLNSSNYVNNIIVAHGEFNKVYLMHLLGWDTAEFEKWANQKNGEVWIVEDGRLSTLTPLRHNTYSRLRESIIKTEI